MYCSSCGAETPEAARFCTACGAPRGPAGTGATHQQSQQDTLIGTVIEDKYRIDARIGIGGMATVYRATRLLIGDTVAVKILHAEQLRDSQAVERFRREAQAAARLKHANAVTIYDFGVSADGAVYLVMELVEGQSLRHLLKERGPLTPSAAAEIVTQVCAALDEAHQQQIVHRDVKPDNIIVATTASGAPRVKVLDFGIARLRDLSALGSLTVTGSVMGTPHYMSPEQCLGEELDHRSDIYSLGVVLYEMLAGVVPFNSPTSTAIIVQHVSGTPAPIRALNVSIPPAVETVIMRSLAKRRDDRPQSTGLLAQELAAAIANTSDTFAAVPQSGTFGTAVQRGTGGFLPTMHIPAPQALTHTEATTAPQSLAAPTAAAAPGRSAVVLAGAAAVLLLAAVSVAWVLLRPNAAPPPASLTVRTEAESAVLVNGREFGATNAEGFLNLTELQPGQHVVTIRKAGFQEQQRTVTLAESRTELLEVGLQRLPGTGAPPEAAAGGPAPIAIAAAPPPPASLPVPPPTPPGEASMVIHAPAGSAVLVDGAQVGTTDANGYLNVPKLRPGRHLVAVQKEGHREDQRSVTTAAGRNELLRVDLVPLPSRLNVTVTPPDAELVVDNVGRYRGPIQDLQLRQGVYTLRASKTGFTAASRVIEIGPGQVENVSIELEPMSASDLLADADRRLKARDFKGAAAISRDVLTRDGTNATAHVVLGQALYNTGAYADSARHLNGAVSLGAEVVLDVAHHHGGLSEDVCLGKIAVTRNRLSFRSTTASAHSFSVPSTSVNEVKNEPHKAKRVNVNLGIQEGARVAKRDFNFHHPEAKGYPVSRSNPQSLLRVECPRCDDRMVVLYSILQAVER